MNDYWTRIGFLYNWYNINIENGDLGGAATVLEALEAELTEYRSSQETINVAH